jgi:hypothetical protein
MQREEWMLNPPEASDLLSSESQDVSSGLVDTTL